MSGRSVTELSVTDGCRWRGDDRHTMDPRVLKSVVNIAQSYKIYELARFARGAVQVFFLERIGLGNVDTSLPGLPGPEKLTP